jgi:hypothetical protein
VNVAAGGWHEAEAPKLQQSFDEAFHKRVQSCGVTAIAFERSVPAFEAMFAPGGNQGNKHEAGDHENQDHSHHELKNLTYKKPVELIDRSELRRQLNGPHECNRREQSK